MQNVPPVEQDELDHQVPQRRSVKLHQVMNVGNEARTAQDGEALVYDSSRGLWVPKNVIPGPGDITNTMLADGVVTETKMANLSVATRALITGSVTTDKIADNAVGPTKIPDGSISDAKIGNRTAEEFAAPSSTGTLSSLINGFSYMIRGITGKTSWRTLPAITLEALSNHHNRHATGGADALTPADIGAASTAHTHVAATTNTAGFMQPTQVTRLGEIGRSNVHTRTTNISTPSGSITTVAGPVAVDRYGYWQILMMVAFSGLTNDDNRISIELYTSLNAQTILSYQFVKAGGQIAETFTGVYFFHRSVAFGSQSFFLRVVPNTSVTVTNAQIAATWTGQDPESQT